LYTGVEPSLPFVFRTTEMPAGLQISTVVETFRDREVPPALPSYEDDANIQSGTVPSSEPGMNPGLQRSIPRAARRRGPGDAALRPGNAIILERSPG
jgi:hypothetical protein